MATVRERFKKELAAKGLTGEEAEKAMSAAFPNLRWTDLEKEYPEQFYQEKPAEIMAQQAKKTAKLPPVKKTETQ